MVGKLSLKVELSRNTPALSGCFQTTGECFQTTGVCTGVQQLSNVCPGVPQPLNVPHVGDQLSPWTTFKVGLFSGAFLVLMIAMVFSAVVAKCHKFPSAPSCQVSQVNVCKDVQPLNVSQSVQPRKTRYRFSRGYMTKAWNHATVDTTATTTCFEPDAELPMDVEVDTTTTHRDADQEGVETKLHALLSPRIIGESTRWDCSKLNLLTQAPNKLFSPLDSASDAAFHIRINEEGLPYCPSKGEVPGQHTHGHVHQGGVPLLHQPDCSEEEAQSRHTDV